MPLVQQLYDKYQNRGLIVLNINLSNSVSGVAKFMTEKNYTIPTLVDVQGNARHDYKIQYVPTTYFIDRDGFIRDKSVGGWQSLEQIEQRLSKIMP